MVRLPWRYWPLVWATVFPGQLPVCCFKPVKPLKMVLFPVFGFPARATRGSGTVSESAFFRFILFLRSGQSAFVGSQAISTRVVMDERRFPYGCRVRELVEIYRTTYIRVHAPREYMSVH